MIDLGDIWALTITAKNAAGTPTNATTMTLTVTEPDGVVAVSALTVTGTAGVYQYDFVTTKAGRHIARWVSTGAALDTFVTSV